MAPQQYVAIAPSLIELASAHVLHPLGIQIDQLIWIASHSLIETRFSGADKRQGSSQDSLSLVNQQVLAGGGWDAGAAIREDALGTVDLFDQHCAEKFRD